MIKIRYVYVPISQKNIIIMYCKHTLINKAKNKCWMSPLSPFHSKQAPYHYESKLKLQDNLLQNSTKKIILRQAMGNILQFHTTLRFYSSKFKHNWHHVKKDHGTRKPVNLKLKNTSKIYWRSCYNIDFWFSLLIKMGVVIQFLTSLH